MQFNNPIRTRQYNEIKTKTKEISFSTLTQEVLQANYLVHSMNKDIQKCDPCLSGWKREQETGTLIPLWYECNQLSQSISKHRRPGAHKRT